MEGKEKFARAALKNISEWRWISGDPDGNTWPIYMDLGEAINRLAMAGYVQPQSLVLKLLCQGDLTGHGDFKWRKYQFGSFFQHEEQEADLDKRQWQTLSDLIDDYQRELTEDGWPFNSVELEKLGIEDCQKYEWSFSASRFSTAYCPPEAQLHDKDYVEEWFSAWDIKIRPARLVWDGDSDIEAVPVAEISRGGRPLAEWWPDFVAELVAYVSEVGVPLGVGHEGQSEVIRDVSARLQERGKEEPSRSQVQEVVNTVLRRMRLAGK